MRKLYFILIASLAGLLSCTGPETNEIGILKEMTFRAYAESSPQSRTSLGEDRSEVLWDADDEIAVFPSTGGAPLRFVNTSEDPDQATFTGLAPDAEFYFAVYPYQEDAVIEDDGEYISAIIPNVQAAKAGSFADGANLAIAFCEPGNDLYFKNVGGLLAFSFNTSHTVRSVRISGSGSSFSGRSSIMMDSEGNPSVETYGETYDHVELQGTFESSATYYAVALPGSYSGLSLTFTDSNGATAVYSNPVTLRLDRNAVMLIGNFNIPESKWVLPEAQEYVKMDGALDDWTGKYLIVSGGYAASGVVTSNWLESKPVTIVNDKIEKAAPASEYEVEINPVQGASNGYSIRFANGNYLGTTNSNSGIKTTTAAPSSSDTEFIWTFSWDKSSSAVKIASFAYAGRILRLNGTSGFRAYTSTTGTQATLFKGPTGSGAAPKDEITSSGVGTRTASSAVLTASYKCISLVPSSAGFRYGPGSSLGNTAYAESLTSTSGTFTVALTGLNTGSTYSYQAFIVVGGVRHDGPVKTFTTESVGSGRGWYELPKQKDLDGNGIDDDNSDYYYSWTMRADASNIRNFSACYSKSKRHPVWVAAPMHISYKGSSGRNEAYKDDPAIGCEQSAKFSGYTRGHMLGSSDRTVTVSTNKQVFYYSNIGAQLQSGFNTGGGAWNNLEELVDSKWCADTLYQVIGCIFETFTDKYGVTTQKKTALNSAGKEFQVPTAWYKVLLRTKSGSTGKSVRDCTSEDLMCVGFILSHRSNHQHDPEARDMYSVKEIEDLTGLEFFVNVPNAPKTTYKASDWGL